VELPHGGFVRPGPISWNGAVRPLLLALIVAAVLAIASAAGAAQIVQPNARPYRVATDARGNLVAFTIVATGFRAGAPVYVEQCDGTSPTSPNWSPADHCDNGTSPSPVYADGSGRATFDAHDRNHKFTPFVGDSPQGLFVCGVPGNCTVRVSTNNASATDDQVFLVLALPRATPTTNPPTSPTTKPSTSSGGHGSSQATGSSASGSTASSATQTASGSSSTGGGSGPLAFTGISAILTGVALVLLGFGVALLARSKS